MNLVKCVATAYRGARQPSSFSRASSLLGFTSAAILALLIPAGPVLAEEPEEPIDDPNVYVPSDSHLFRTIASLRSDYDWLHDELISDDIRDNYSEDNIERTFYVHMRDSLGHFDLPDTVASSELPDSCQEFLVRGDLSYVQLVQMPYRYTVAVVGDEITIVVQVHFKNAGTEAVDHFTRMFALAENVWNGSTAQFPIGYPYRFQFQVVDDAGDAHFSVKLKEGTRGPYAWRWNPHWSHFTVAHELGHMMGLGDEYRTFSGELDCVLESLMCAWNEPMPHHYYFILRRLFDLEARPGYWEE